MLGYRQYPLRRAQGRIRLAAITYGYLNLIEPWWKTLRSLALKGRHFEVWTEMVEPIRRATAYWNDHKHPYIWGRRRRHRTPRKLGVAALPTVSAF